MPDISENRRHWGKDYSWQEQGDEWSARWGGPFHQWHWSIRPRIARFLPASMILEIAPGFGRWTQFLLKECESYTGVDLNMNCVHACQSRFATVEKARFYVNDGRSLEMIPDGTVDFVFSFDSLVHANIGVLEDYLRQLRNKLKPEGVGFLHHSNIGEYQRWWSIRNRLLPTIVRKQLTRWGWIQYYHWRDFSVSHAKVRRLCDQTGLVFGCQEMINWRGSLLIDCLTTFGREKARLPASEVLANGRFMHEADYIRKLASIYRR